jgi:hypothetical protein
LTRGAENRGSVHRFYTYMYKGIASCCWTRTRATEQHDGSALDRPCERSSSAVSSDGTQSGTNGEQRAIAVTSTRATKTHPLPARSRREALEKIATRQAQRSPPSRKLMPATETSPDPNEVPLPLSPQKSPPSWVLTPTAALAPSPTLAWLNADSSHLLSPPSPAEANSLLMERAGVWVYDSNFDDAWPTTVLNSITMARPARKLEEPEHLGPRIARASCSPVLCTASDAPSAVPLDRRPLKLKPPRNTAQEPAPLTMLAGGTPRPPLNNVSSKRPLEPLKFRV